MSRLVVLDSAPPHPADVISTITHRDLSGVRVLFINMPLRETAPPVDAPEGPLLLATNLRQTYGVDATVIDLNAYRIKDADAEHRGLRDGRHLSYREARHLIEEHIRRFGEPDVVGLSGKITTLRWQQLVAAMLRELLPDVFLVSGNGLATELRQGLFTYVPQLDAICHSDGDDAVVKIVYDAKQIRDCGFTSALQSGKLKPYYVGDIGGRHRFVYDGDRHRNLNALPYADLDLLKEDALGNPVRDWFLNVPLWGLKANNSSATPWRDDEVTPKTQSVSSRGCPFGCTYCFRGANGERSWTVRSAQHIHDELAHNQAKYGIKFHGFHDDNFAVTADRIAAMVPLVGPLGIWWGTHTRLDEVAGLSPVTGKFENPLRVELMAKAGCRYIGFGPESASASVLKAIGKGGHTLTNGFADVTVSGERCRFPRSMVEGILNTLRFGIHSNCTWILGSPTETLDDVKETVRFIRWQTEIYQEYGVPVSSVNQRMFTMTWYPGVAMINSERVRSVLSRVFGLTFVPMPAGATSTGASWQPLTDEAFYRYLIELDDATKVLRNPTSGEALHFSEMTADEFLRVRDCVDSGNLFKVLDL